MYKHFTKEKSQYQDSIWGTVWRCSHPAASQSIKETSGTFPLLK